METDFHRRAAEVLTSSLDEAWAERNDFFVGANMFVYFSPTQERDRGFRGPDVFVVMGCERRDRDAWVCWEEGWRTPDVIIELTSPSTAHVDRGEKMQVYAWELPTPAYYIFDPATGQLEGWELSPEQTWVPLAPDERGDLDCDPLGLRLGVRVGFHGPVQRRWLRWIDAQGLPLPTPAERAIEERLRAQAERERAEAERERAEAERERAEAAEAEREAERQRAERAEQRVEEIDLEREAERQRAESLAAELERLRALLGRGQTGE